MEDCVVVVYVVVAVAVVVVGAGFGACADDCVAQLHAVQFSSATGTTGDGAVTKMRKWQEKLLSNGGITGHDMSKISSNILSLSLSR